MTWQLAQMNVGTIRYPLDDPRMSGFANRLDEINALADRSPGFVWRLQSDSGNATDIDTGRGEYLLVNMSVWESIEKLFQFVYQSGHRNVMIKRRQWFERPGGAYQVLWWIPAGHVPTVEEGLARLDTLTKNGPGENAFTFQQTFPPPDRSVAPDNLEPDPFCSGWR